DTRAGVVDTVRRTLIDIAPTIGEFLDFSTPYCEGVSIVPVRPPAIPVLLSPVDDARFQQIDLSLLWNQVPRTVHYHLQLSTTPSFDHLIIDDSLLGWNSKNVGPLDLNTTYYWRTRARNSGGSSAWSDTRRFTTVSTMPPVVLLTSPKNATTVSADSVELSWTTASPEAGCYYLEIALDSLMTRIFLADSAISGTAWMFRCTKNKTVFWWRVKARYFTGWAEWSQKGSFIVDIPVIFVPPERFSLDCDKSYKSGTPFVVRYNLPRASPVAIRLYSINGQLVKTLFKQVQQPEYHRLTLRSLPLSTGYYLLDFEAGEYKSTRRFYAY
ncbi:MAG: T9SS type A sorting domain-containing protein, partial [Chitinispirillaceae bacterium]|nr:T9SS type A sorting domain-containing protein [Chitinispirillaceae bacterium]